LETKKATALLKLASQKTKPQTETNQFPVVNYYWLPPMSVPIFGSASYSPLELVDEY
jgi:hypothetical protein